MRIYLDLTSNTTPVPFNYQKNLVYAFHKWLGKNDWHDDISLYSLSWLNRGGKIKGGLNFPNGSTFFITTPLEDIRTKLLKGVFNDPLLAWGMNVQNIRVAETPNFGTRQYFIAQSPILIKHQQKENTHAQYYYPGDLLANQYLTDILQSKLHKANLRTDVSVRFDPNYKSVNIKKIIFNKIDIKAALCPVIIEGNARTVQFAWEVGVGNSTGIGFGALR